MLLFYFTDEVKKRLTRYLAGIPQECLRTALAVPREPERGTQSSPLWRSSHSPLQAWWGTEGMEVRALGPAFPPSALSSISSATRCPVSIHATQKGKWWQGARGASGHVKNLPQQPSFLHLPAGETEALKDK